MSFRKLYDIPYDLLKDRTFRWWLILGCMAFCLAFLCIFEPYGLYRIDNERNKIALISLYVGGSFISSAIHFTIQDFVIKKYTLGNTILWIALYFLIVGSVVSAIHEYMFNGGDYRLKIFWVFQRNILSIAIIPMTIFVLIHYNLTLKKRLQMATALTRGISSRPQEEEKDCRIAINSENKKESFEMPLRDLIYITSSDNYIDVFYLSEGKPVHCLLRYTLSGVEADNADVKEIWRCHKSYIINKRKIESVSGNTAGYRIKLSGCDANIPVSRKLNKNLSSLISD